MSAGAGLEKAPAQVAGSQCRLAAAVSRSQQPHQVHPPTLGVTVPEFENQCDDNGTSSFCPECELAAIHAAVCGAHETDGGEVTQ